MCPAVYPTDISRPSGTQQHVPLYTYRTNNKAVDDRAAHPSYRSDSKSLEIPANTHDVRKRGIRSWCVFKRWMILKSSIEFANEYTDFHCVLCWPSFRSSIPLFKKFKRGPSVYIVSPYYIRRDDNICNAHARRVKWCIKCRMDGEWRIVSFWYCSRRYTSERRRVLCYE
jgi:hypothetical protein